MVILDLTAFPPFFPGFHLGEFSITAIAAWSNPGLAERITSISWMDPSILITNLRNTVPSIPNLCSFLGYFRLFSGTHTKHPFRLGKKPSLR